MNKSTILTILASVGIVGTAIATAKAVPKAQKKIAEAESQKGSELTTTEKVKASADCYIPPALIGAGTVACVLGANALNKQQQASLVSSFTILEQCYKNYRGTLIDLHGPAADEEVRERMADTANLQRTNSQVCYVDVESDRYLKWYEPISDQWFEADERFVMDAEYHFNRNYVLMRDQNVNDLLYFLNLPDMGERGDELVWIPEEGYLWIDFEHEEVRDGDDVYYVINCVTPPSDSTDKEWQKCYG